MKEIIIQIDERAIEQLKAKKKLMQDLDGCVRGPSIEEAIIYTMLDKIDKGSTLMEVGIKGEKLQ